MRRLPPLTAIEAFVAAPGYAAFDVDTIHDAGSPYEKNFPTSGAAATHADAMVGPIEKALLLVNSLSGFIDRVGRPKPARVEEVAPQ